MAILLIISQSLQMSTSFVIIFMFIFSKKIYVKHSIYCISYESSIHKNYQEDGEIQHLGSWLYWFSITGESVHNHDMFTEQFDRDVIFIRWWLFMLSLGSREIDRGWC